MEPEKNTPMTVSSLILSFWLTRAIPSATAMAKKAPVRRGFHPARMPMATPPMAEWEIPTPMNARRRSTTKKPRTPHKTPTRTAATNARCMKAKSNIRKVSV